MSEEEAEEVYQKAKSRYMLLAHAAAAVGTTDGSAVYQLLHQRLSGKTEGKAVFEDMTSYQEIYGKLDYCSCPKCKSIFGPGAYFVDLMRMIELHIELEEGNEGVSLKARRPDLFELKLSCENTNRTEPYLDRANAILEDYLGKDGLYLKLAKQYSLPPLPFILPLEQIRAHLEDQQVKLSDVFSVLLLPKQSIWMEEMDLTPDEYDYLSEPLSDEKMKLFWGLSEEDAERMAGLVDFLKETGMKHQEADRLFMQDIADEEPDREQRLHALYINKSLDDEKYLYIEGDRIQNMNADTLKRICGFLRICQTFGTDYGETNRLIEAAGGNAEGRIDIFGMGQFLKVAKIFSLSVEEAVALSRPMKDYGSNLFAKVFGMERAAFDKLDPWLQERQMQKALDISAEEFRVLRAYLEKVTDFFPDAVYRHIKLAHLFGMTLDVWVRFLVLACPEHIETFTPTQIIELMMLCKELPYSIDELEYLMTLKSNPYLAAGITSEDFAVKIALLRQGVQPDGTEDALWRENYVYEQFGAWMEQKAEDVKTLFRLVLTKEELIQWPQKVLQCPVEELKPVVDEIYRLLYLTGKGMSIQLLETVFTYKEAFGMRDDMVWTLEWLGGLTFFAGYVRQCQDSQGQLLAFVRAYMQDGDISLLARASGWEEQETADVMVLLYPDKAEEKNIPTLICALANVMSCEQKLSVHADVMKKLGALAYFPGEVYDPEKYYAEAQRCEEEIFGSDLPKKVRAVLAKRKRDALLPVVMKKLQETYADIDDYNKLYKFFLIDVEMDEKTMISPVKEGINALQLYLQRCRLRLEKGVRDITVPQSWWTWIMDYRMWEANRKVFVYPENYLEPSLRKSKTKLFQNTEDALCQSKITDGYIEEQYVKYLDDYLELTQLKICGAYETEEDYIDVLYVFARTKKQPYTYYYCRRASTLAWSEWTKIDINIDAENITPVFVFNRLHIFWSVVKENTKVKVKSADALNAENEKSYTLQIKYTYKNLQGKWITPQSLQEDTVIYNKEENNVECLSKAADQFGIHMEDHSFDKLTLLRFTHHNLDGVMDKGADFECLAVITGSFSQNLGKFMENLNEKDTLDQEQTAFVKFINRMIDNHNFEIHNGEDGYFSTGYFKLFNEELEEIHLIHDKEFLVVDGYAAPNHALIYKPVHDVIHRAVGLMLSQEVIKDAALPAKGILPFDNKETGPVLDSHAFVAADASGNVIIDQAMSEKIYTHDR